MNMYEQWKTDARVEKSGIAINYGTFRVTVARAGGGNKAYQKALEEKFRPYRRVLRNDAMTEEQATELFMELYAERVVRNWEVLRDGAWVEGIEQEDGSLVPVTVENVLATFKKLPDLFADLQSQAGSAALYRAASLEMAKGNS